MKTLSQIAFYVDDRISSNDIDLEQYVTTDSLLQNKEGRTLATNLPPQPCSLLKYQIGDILVANIRPYLRKIWLADSEGGASNDVLVFRAKEGYTAEYLYSILLDDRFFNYVMLAPTGAKMPRGEKTHIMRYSVFDIGDNAVSVGNFVSTIYKKIALNREENATLEAMAKQLYEYWFVQFDFPDANGNPYKSSGGKMVWNEKLKREIPEGWEVKTVNQLCNSQRGVSFDASQTTEDGILILRGNNIKDNHLVYDNNTVYVPSELVSDAQRIKKNDIIMTMSSGSKEHIGKCMMFHYDSAHSYGAFMNRFRPKDCYAHYVFLFMISPFFKALIKSKCGGTGINNLTNKTFDDIVLPCPSDNLIMDFDTKVSSLFEKIGSNELEITELTNLRDFLLPLLMNGQVSIKE